MTVSRLPMRALFVIVAAVVAAGCEQVPQEPPSPIPEPAEHIFRNGDIYTMNPARPRADTLAVRAGRILAVGIAKDILARHRGSGTEVVDLGGRMVMPGINDTHVHLAQAGTRELFECGFPFSLGVEAILDKVESCAASTPPGEWLRGGQWAMELLNSEKVPHRRLLDAVAPDNPVFLIDSTVHGAWVNTRGLEALGIDADTPDPEGGVIVRDAAGEATGILFDNAAYQAMYTLPSYSPEQMQDALQWAMGRLNAVGVTGIKDAIVDAAALEAYAALDRSDALTGRVAASLAWRMAWAGPQVDLEATVAGRAAGDTANVDPDFIKIMLDGVPPARTAAVLEPYLNADGGPGTDAGYLMVSPEQLREDMVKLDARGLTVKIHATGDRAVRVALDAVAAARDANGDSGLRHEIAHAEMIHPDDLPRFSALNVTAEMSPILWYPSPLHFAMEQVLGQARAGRFWPVKSLLESGAEVIYGSDWPSVVPSPSPWPGIEAMVTRRDPYGRHPGTLGPEQALDLETVLGIFTVRGARAIGAGDVTGTIEPGKSADFIVLDRNLFEIAPGDISETRVIMTVFRGDAVYRAGEP